MGTMTSIRLIVIYVKLAEFVVKGLQEPQSEKPEAKNPSSQRD